MEKTFTDMMVEQAQVKFDQAVRNHNFYGQLVNWRDAKVNDERHKAKVFTGYAKIMNLLARSVK